MTVAKSTMITNLEAGNRETERNRGRAETYMETVALGTGDIDAADVVHMVAVPMDCAISSIKLFNDDLDSNGSPTITCNVGIYYGPETGQTAGTVVDADAFATVATTLQAANTSGVELRFEAADINGIKSEVWELGGLSSNPGGHAYISLTIGTGAATAAAGDVTMVVETVKY